MLRRFLRYFLPLLIIFAALVGAAYRWESRARLAELKQTEERYVALAAESLAHDFRAVIADLLLLADAGSLRRALQSGEQADFTRLAEEFRNMAEKKRVYDQIRFLDLEGNEVLRVNYDGEQAHVVPEQALQLKVDRYYFHETIDLDAGTVFVSPFDLNVEDGRIERPYKPTVRFGTPVFDADSRRRGIVILNYLGANMLRRFARLDVDSPGRAMLLNADGYWLYTDDASRAWAFMLGERQGDDRGGRLEDDFPTAWERIHAREAGQVQSAEGLFTFATVKPLAEAMNEDAPVGFAGMAASSREYVWHVVSHVRPAELGLYLSGVRQNMLGLSIVLLAIAGGGSWALARYSLARERSEAALRESEARFRQMADSIAEVFWLSTTDRRRLHYVSPAFAEIWGRRFDSLDDAANIWEDSILPDDRPALENVLRGLGAVDDFSSEYRIRRADGKVRWIWDHGFAVRGADGGITGYAGIAEDVTPLQEAQHKALQAERLAAIGEAMAGLAHESRNALQRSQACLEMLQKRVAGQPEPLNLLERIQAAVSDLHHLYERVRCYAAPIQIRRDSCDLKLLWEQVCRDTAECAPPHRPIKISRSTAEEGSLPDTRCCVDALAIRQVFRNILENALDPELDASANREAVEVNVDWAAATWQRSPSLKIRISDNGPGLDESSQERIFEPFFTTKTRGTGLGLAISRRIVEAHGGTISAANGQHQGLTLEIILPKGPV